MSETGRREKDLTLVEDFEYVRAVTADGNSVRVPKSMFGGNLEIANENVLGGIKASEKSETDTQEVKIDPVTGKLFVPKGEGTPPDDEDITVAEIDGEERLQFKDKKYNASSFSGLGRVYLRKNMVDGVNVLTQAMFTNDDGSVRSNTRYIIQYDYDLDGGTITVPEGCVLDFQGGSFSNGTIIFTYTHCINPSFHSVRFSGTTADDYFNVENYGALMGNAGYDNAILINDLIALQGTGFTNSRQRTIYVPAGIWDIYTPIIMYGYSERVISLIGSGYSSFIRQRTDNIYICKMYETVSIKNIALHYYNRQPVENTKAVAVACQRCIFSQFDNLVIHNSHTAVGYIAVEDFDYVIVSTQSWVNAAFNNVRISRFSGYAFDFYKEVGDGDSGSVYNNIYINTAHYLGEDTGEEIGISAIRGHSTVAHFSMLNIEGGQYSSPLIDTIGNCKFTIGVLHVEIPNSTPSIIRLQNNSQVIVSLVDVQRIIVKTSNYRAFTVVGNSHLEVCEVMFRADCSKSDSSTVVMIEDYTGNSYTNIGKVTDVPGIVDKIYLIGNYVGTIRYGMHSFGVQYSSSLSNFKKNNFYQLLDRGNLVYKDNDSILRNPMGIRMQTTDGLVARLIGTTAQRPALNEDHEGFEYYDRTLKKKIIWNGTEWTNVDGTNL